MGRLEGEGRSLQSGCVGDGDDVGDDGEGVVARRDLWRSWKFKKKRKVVKKIIR